MFYAIWKQHWRPVEVYAVDTRLYKFLINVNDEFTWVDMDEFVPI